MNVVIFGATGMVGQGVLRECLGDPGVARVLTVGRGVTGQRHARLTEIAHADMLDFAPIAASLTGYDACFFCLGITSAGTSEEDYARVTYGIPIAAGRTLSSVNPGMTFVFVSARGADSTEKGSTMWARVKGKAENALAAMPFKATYVLRPAIIEPLHGIKSRTRMYNAAYFVLRPLVPVVRALFPHATTTTENVGRAMLRAARDGAPKRILESDDINELASLQPPLSR